MKLISQSLEYVDVKFDEIGIIFFMFEFTPLQK